MRSRCRSVGFLLLMDSKLPPRVGRAWRPIRRVVDFGPRCINRLVFSRGSSESGQLLELGVKGGQRSRKWPLAYRNWLAHRGKYRGWRIPESGNCLPLLGSVVGGAVEARI
ncbi:hypothetical protein AVEN_10521-1 [Araneus ventricosus]|uniref:Uncharacterized protein n=1 Tax=Araneus ventricosus TaxID=182803 RepID=A0A4Y2PVK3_ARAVE|nr:hypothetical protein AVEN_10521-1 [Araneus ventricosus]